MLYISFNMHDHNIVFPQSQYKLFQWNAQAN